MSNANLQARHIENMKRGKTVRELINIFEKLCSDVTKGPGSDFVSMSDADPGVFTAESTVLLPKKVAQAPASIVASAVQMAKQTEDIDEHILSPQRAWNNRATKQKILSCELEEQSAMAAKPDEESELENSLDEAHGLGDADRRVAPTVPHLRGNELMAGTVRMNGPFCQQLNELLKMHAFTQQFILRRGLV